LAEQLIHHRGFSMIDVRDNSNITDTIRHNNLT
jgi:hypothetical protein